MSQVAYDAMQTGAARHTKTGVLFQSIYNRSAGPERREVGHDPQRAPYAPFVIFGTRPHRIAPKKRRPFAGLAAVRSSLQNGSTIPATSATIT